MENKCESEKGSCETTQETCKPAESCCPVEQATQLWQSAFCEALKQAHVEALKTRIQKAWGAKIDKGADAVIEAMGAQWAAKLQGAKAHVELKEKLKDVMFQHLK